MNSERRNLAALLANNLSISQEEDDHARMPTVTDAGDVSGISAADAFMIMCIFAKIDKRFAVGFIELVDRFHLKMREVALFGGAVATISKDVKGEIRGLPNMAVVEAHVNSGPDSFMGAYGAKSEEFMVNQANVVRLAVDQPHFTLTEKPDGDGYQVSRRGGQVFWSGEDPRWADAEPLFHEYRRLLKNSSWKPLPKWAYYMASIIMQVHDVELLSDGTLQFSSARVPTVPTTDDSRDRQKVVGNFINILRDKPIATSRSYYNKEAASSLSYTIVRHVTWPILQSMLPAHLRATLHNFNGLYGLFDATKYKRLRCGNSNLEAKAGILADCHHGPGMVSGPELAAIQYQPNREKARLGAEEANVAWRKARGETQRNLDPTKDIGLTMVDKHVGEAYFILEPMEFFSNFVPQQAPVTNVYIIGDATGATTRFISKVFTRAVVESVTQATITNLSEYTNLRAVEASKYESLAREFIAKANAVASAESLSVLIVCNVALSGTDDEKVKETEKWVDIISGFSGYAFLSMTATLYHIPIDRLMSTRETRLVPIGRRGNRSMAVIVAPLGRTRAYHTFDPNLKAVTIYDRFQVLSAAQATNEIRLMAFNEYVPALQLDAHAETMIAPPSTLRVELGRLPKKKDANATKLEEITERAARAEEGALAGIDIGVVPANLADVTVHFPKRAPVPGATRGHTERKKRRVDEIGDDGVMVGHSTYQPPASPYHAHGGTPPPPGVDEDDENMGDQV